MSKKLQPKTLIITKTVYKKALRYAMSLNEVGFLFFGKGNRITEVVRIKNTHADKENRFIWDTHSYNKAIEIHSKFDLIVEGHSHSKSNHLKKPSKADLKYFKPGFHIIVFPTDKYIDCWLLGKEVLVFPLEVV